MALVHLSYSEFKNIYGDLGLTYWAKYNWLSEANWYSLEVLPKDYEKVAYIESTGEQYIDSGVVLNDKNFKIEVNFEEALKTSEEQAIVSIWSRSYLYWNLFLRNADNEIKVDLYLNGHNYLDGSIELNKEYVIGVGKVGNNFTFYVDDNLKTISYTPAYINTISVKIFARGDLEDGSSNTHIKLYRSKFYVEDELVRYFVPCVRKSDNEAGLYDLVNNEFYANDGTGDFVIPS